MDPEVSLLLRGAIRRFQDVCQCATQLLGSRDVLHSEGKLTLILGTRGQCEGHPDTVVVVLTQLLTHIIKKTQHGQDRED